MSINRDLFNAYNRDSILSHFEADFYLLRHVHYVGITIIRRYKPQNLQALHHQYQHSLVKSGPICY